MDASIPTAREKIAASPARTTALFGTMPLVTAAILLAVLLFDQGLLHDPDTLWQVRTGEWILDHRAVPFADPFSYTFAGHRWFAHEWLAEVLLALAWRAADWGGVAALAAGACALTFGLLARDLRRFMPPAPALLLVIGAVALLQPMLLARPHLLAWPCLELWCAGLVVARAQGRAPSLALLPVMTLWANLHGSFMLGLLLPLFFLFEAMLAGERLAGWIRFIACAWPAALITPETVDGLLFPFRMIGMEATSTIIEWQPPDFAQTQPLEVAILLAMWAGLSGGVRLPRLRVLLLLVLLHLTLRHARYEQLLAIVGILIVAQPIGALLPPRRNRSIRWLLPAAACVFGVAVVARAALPMRNDVDTLAATALDRVPPALRAQPVLNDYFYGGPLIFAGIRPFVDGRADMYGDAFIQRYRAIISPDQDALEAALADYKVAWTFFRADNPVVLLLDREPGWHRLYTDQFVVVHARSDAPGP